MTDTTEISLTVRYFAILREQRGLSEERLTLPATTAGDLYDQLRRTHGFSLEPTLVRVAVNHAFTPSSTPLTDGDEVVFIPPVAGG